MTDISYPSTPGEEMTLSQLEEESRQASLDRWSQMTVAGLVHEFAVTRGDLSHSYARDQLVALLERKILLFERNLDTTQEALQRVRDEATTPPNVDVALALHGPKSGHVHTTFLASGGRIIRMACKTCNDAYPCATAKALGAGREPHDITLPDYRIGEGWLYCTTCGRAVYLKDFPDQLEGPWVHVGEEQQ